MDVSRLLVQAELLVESAKEMLSGLQSFEDRVHSCVSHETRSDHIAVTGVKAFKSNINAEVKTMERGIEGLRRTQTRPTKHETIDVPESQVQALQCSNIRYFLAIWAIAVQCRAIKAIRNRISYQKGGRKHSVMVDIIAENGEQWVKVSTTREHRMLLEIAREGLALEDFDVSDSETGQSAGSSASNGITPELRALSIVRIALELKQAAQNTWVNYKHPRIHLIFTNILEGKTKQIDLVLSELRSLGVVVECSVSPRLDEQQQPSNTPQETLRLMTPAAYHPPLTNVLNLDCSILICLISDISHCAPSTLLHLIPTSTSVQQYRTIQREIEYEDSMPLLPTNVYPTLRGRNLVCTADVMNKCQEIVNTVGTKDEKRRFELLVGSQAMLAQEDEEKHVRAAFQDKSIHALPDDLQLPLNVQTFDPKSSSPMLRELELTDVHKSAFFYGLTRNITTVTSSRLTAREVRQRILKWAEKNNQEHVEGPDIWISAFSRSLLSKGKKIDG